MRAVVQRVSSARVSVDDRIVGAIDRGLLVLAAVATSDGDADVAYLAGKIGALRVFEDADRRMNLSVEEAGGQILLVSQFTLLGDCRKGRRPSFDRAAAPDRARTLYEDLASRLRARGLRVETGEFQAMMRVALVNDGPVTLLLDSTKLF